MGGTKEEEEQGAVVEVIRKPDPWLAFKGNWISLQCLLISQECGWSPWCCSEFLAEISWRNCTSLNLGAYQFHVRQRLCPSMH